MEHLWSSWRHNYISSFSEKKDETGCFLCNAARHTHEYPFFVFDGREAIVIMNRYPYNNGHILVAPKQHIADLTGIKENLYKELADLQKVCYDALTELYRPSGINMGANIGAAAGAGVPGHLHYHLLPRWEGDTNFMATVADTRVVSEAMELGQKKLKEYFKQRMGG